MWKLQDLESAVIWSEKERCSSKMKPRLRAECVVLRGHFCTILASCCLSPMRRNSVLEELRVSRLADYQSSKKRFLVKQSGAWRCQSEDRVDKKRRKAVCRLHTGGG